MTEREIIDLLSNDGTFLITLTNGDHRSEMITEKSRILKSGRLEGIHIMRDEDEIIGIHYIDRVERLD